MYQITPKVSVIVPIYNVERYLQSCIDSIFNQTYPYMEIILVDDGSPDLCGEICDKNAMLDDRIRVIHQENEGLSSARNAGLDLAAGEYIVFVDADDTIHAQFIEILLDLCEREHCDIAQCDFLVVSEDSVRLPLNPQQSLSIYSGKQALSRMCMGNDNVKYLVPWNKIYRQSLFQGIRYPVGRIHEDEFVTHKILWEARKVAVTNQYLYYYLKRSDSIMGSEFSMKRLDCHIAFQERLEFLKKIELKEEYEVTLQNYINLIERDCKLLKQYVGDCENVCAELVKKRESLMKQLRPTILQEEPLRQVNWTIRNCPYQKEDRLVLYGAGKWGCIYYQWICKNHWGRLVGWVDNFWYKKVDSEYIVSPLDLLLKLSYDYVLIAIESKTVQNEVIGNLVCWGVPRKKILVI